jgi:hypothetical protein
MFLVFSPSSEVVKEGRISFNIRLLKDQLWVSFWLGPVCGQDLEENGHLIIDK